MPSGSDEVEASTGVPRDSMMSGAQLAADADEALSALARIARRDADAVRRLHSDEQGWRALWALLGASTGFADFFHRNPAELSELAGAGVTLPSSVELRDTLLDADHAAFDHHGSGQRAGHRENVA